jgi:hypothetical protein
VLKKLVFCLTCALLPVSAWAELIEFEAGDFTVTPTFSEVQTFQFSIELAEEVDVDFGEEYVTVLGFDPAALSLTGPIPNLIFENGFETLMPLPPPPPNGFETLTPLPPPPPD